MPNVAKALYTPDDYDDLTDLVESEGERAATFEDFKNAVPKDDARWLLIVFEFVEEMGSAP